MPEPNLPTPMRIRGSYRRRILERLSDAPGTVSEVTSSIGLRMPHVSAELKRLREEGLVQSDEGVSRRGAKQHLTTLGWDAIVDDELARLNALGIDPAPPGTHVCLLAKDGPLLLLAYDSHLDSPLIPVPVSGMASSSRGTSRSSGKEGVMRDWVWAVARERDVRWYDRNTLNPCDPPSEDRDGSKLGDWSADEERIGLLRAKMLDPRQTTRLALGTWFSSPSAGEWPTLASPLGDSSAWTVGTVHPEVPPLSLRSPSFAVLPDRLSTSMVLNAAIEGALTIGEASLVGKRPSALPLSIIPSWIKLAHPRLDNATRLERLEGLIASITKGRRKRGGGLRVSDSTWRKFVSDWGDRDWSRDEPGLGEVIDVKGLGKLARRSLSAWATEREGQTPLVLQLHSDSDKDLQRLLADGRTRLSIISSEPQVRIDHPSLRVSQVRRVPWFRLRLAQDVEIEVDLSNRSLGATVPLPEGWLAPETYDEFHSAREGLSHLFPELRGVTDSTPPMVGRRRAVALAWWPSGNSMLADALETSDPLAGWFACSSHNRWSYWNRRGGELDEGWVHLLLPEQVPVEELPSLAAHSPRSWRKAAGDYMASQLRSDPDLAIRLRSRTTTGSEEGLLWLAQVLVTHSPWVSDELATNLANHLLESIPTSLVDDYTGMIAGFSSLERRSVIGDEWVDALMGLQQDESALKGWQTLIRMSSTEHEPDLPSLRALATLPTQWWSHLAPRLVQTMIQDPISRRFLLESEISWASALLRGAGSINEVPGVGQIEHPGVCTETIDRLLRLVRSAERIDDLVVSDHLMDVTEAIDSLRSGTMPSPGRTHLHVGWLVRPIESWPLFVASDTLDGDFEVGILLTRRESAYVEALESDAQMRF